MLKMLYLCTMAIAFTSNFMGSNTNYYLRLSMGLLWIIIWVIRSKGTLRINKTMRYLLCPWVVIFITTVGLWIINRPVFFNISYITRMISNLIYCIVAVMNAYIGIELLGTSVIDVSFFSLIGSIAVNTISVWQKYGTSLTVTYFKTLLFQDYKFGTPILNLAMDMEVQGATMALGVFFVYYLFYSKDRTRLKRTMYVALSLIGLYIGFKRVVLLGIVLVVAILWVLKFKKVNLKNIIRYTFVVFLFISFGFIFVVKTDLISSIAAYFNVDMMGRTNIYSWVSNLYSLSPLYLGTGYGYMAKYLFETTGFAVHSDILRMYIELGCLPFIWWLWYNIYFIPQKISNLFGNEAGKVCITATVYTFSTFLLENTLGLYPLQYGLTLFTLLYLAKTKEDCTITAMQ